MILDSLLWKPLLEASAQTIVGAVGGYSFTKVLEAALRRNLYEGPLDFWMRGIQQGEVALGDQVFIDGLISPYTQLFPGNPFDNARHWRNIYDFTGEMSQDEYQAMEFFNGRDTSLRLNSLNGESLVGIFARYGYIGEGLIAVAPTTLIRRVLPDFFHPDFFGCAARVGGKLGRCPTQHGFVLQGIAARAGISISTEDYRNLYYLQINSIKPARGGSKRTCSLLGSQWSLTDSSEQQYLIEYGHFNDRVELANCTGRLRRHPQWKDSKVYFDEVDLPSQDLSFSRNFI
jgi:hypothetical protein